jgi:hypothetical protein
MAMMVFTQIALKMYSPIPFKIRVLDVGWWSPALMKL